MKSFHLAFFIAIISAACAPTPTPTQVAINPSTHTPTATPTFVPSATPTLALSSTSSATPTLTDTPTRAPSPTSPPTLTPPPPDPGSPVRPSDTPTRAPAALPPENYGSIPIAGAPADRPAAQHADLNLGLRGYTNFSAPLNFVDYSAPVPGAPQLLGLTEDYRAPKFVAAYRVNTWDWACSCKGTSIDDWDVTLIGLATTTGEGIHTPDTGRDIFSGYRALVLYAETSRITIKYTREDTVANGYTVMLEDIIVEPNLLALYQQENNAGRKSLPALKAHQRLGRASGVTIKVAIRDTGAFMDPRSRKDWWSGK